MKHVVGGCREDCRGGHREAYRGKLSWKHVVGDYRGSMSWESS